MNPTISVIMAVHNQSEYLPAAIKSILQQTFTNFEFIIINDGSTDPRVSGILRRFTDPRVIILKQRHRGLAASLNHGLTQAKGEFIARMDADDIAHPRRFAIQLNFLHRHPNVVACGSAVNLINSQNKTIGRKHYPSRITQSLLMRYNPLIHPTIMLRHSALKNIGNYDLNLNGAEDYDMWLRLCSNHKLTNINKILMDYRINPQGVSWASLKHTELQAIKARWKALTKYNYSLWQIIFLIKPTLTYIIPAQIKKLLFNIS